MRHPGPDELVAAALSALSARNPAPGIETHLRSCPACRAEVESLRTTSRLAREGADQPVQDPPSAVWERVVGELGPELAGAAGRPADPPALHALADESVADRAVEGRTRRRGPVLLAAAALVAGLAGGLAIGLTVGGDPQVPAEVPLVALDPGSGTTGSTGLTEVDGSRVLVVALERDALPAGGYLEAWLMDEGATRLYALGGLAPAGPGRWAGRFVLPPDLPLEVLDTVDVSVEHFDGDPGHSGESLARGRTA
ncbi:anti-sigma factor domain-containing protein [Pseudonocardia sp. RS010]|uniref:anti-sigma factor n=1 Tax=Pseudonocardia sp. RS010 TaxID=3385979 RepID=UPI0039A26E7C